MTSAVIVTVTWSVRISSINFCLYTYIYSILFYCKSKPINDSLQRTWGSIGLNSCTPTTNQESTTSAVKLWTKPQYFRCTLVYVCIYFEERRSRTISGYVCNWVYVNENSASQGVDGFSAYTSMRPQTSFSIFSILQGQLPLHWSRPLRSPCGLEDSVLNFVWTPL